MSGQSIHVEQSPDQSEMIDIWLKDYECGKSLKVERLKKIENSKSRFEEYSTEEIVAEIDIQYEYFSDEESIKREALLEAVATVLEKHGKEVYEQYLNNVKKEESE
jgi:hypothetical protein